MSVGPPSSGQESISSYFDSAVNSPGNVPPSSEDVALALSSHNLQQASGRSSVDGSQPSSSSSRRAQTERELDFVHAVREVSQKVVVDAHDRIVAAEQEKSNLLI